MAHSFKVEIQLGNPSFAGDRVYKEIPRILRGLADEIESVPIMPIDLIDIKGNVVGKAWKELNAP